MNYKCYRCGKDVGNHCFPVNGNKFCEECYCKIFTDEAVPPKQTDEELLADIKRFMAKYGFNCVEDIEEEMILRDIALLRKENKESRKANKQWSKLYSEATRERFVLQRELAELPKKICDKIRECSDVEVDEQGNVWIETDSASLDDIQEKYEKGARNERD